MSSKPAEKYLPVANSVTSLMSRWYSSDSIAVASSCIRSTDSTFAGGRLSVMRVMPWALSTRMFLKVGVLTEAKTSWS